MPDVFLEVLPQLAQPTEVEYFSSIITLQPILLPLYFTQNLPFLYYTLSHFHTQTAQTTSTSTSTMSSFPSNVPDVLREVLPGILREVLPGIFREVLLEAREANTVVFKKTHAHPQQGRRYHRNKDKESLRCCQQEGLLPSKLPPVPQKVHPSCALPFRCVVKWPPLKVVLATLNTSTEDTVVTSYVGLWRYS